MSNSNRLIQIAQQPPAIVFRGDLFSFIAYFPKSSPYGHLEDMQAHHPRAGQDGFTTYSNGGFATADVIPADDRKLPLKNRNDEMVIGTRRADFNRTNEDDRTVRFELGITRTGTFIVIVRLHKKQMRNSRVGDRIITSVVTRKIQVVEQQEQTDTRFNHARYGRLTPPSMGREEEEHQSFDADESKFLRTDTRFNGECDLPRRARLIMPRLKKVTLPEAENSGLNDREDKKSQPISTSTLHQQNARRDDSKPGKDSWSDDDDDSDDEGGVILPSCGRLIMPRPNSTLLETKHNDLDNCSDADDSDNEGGIK